MRDALLVLDTNFYSAFARNETAVKKIMRGYTEIALPHTVLGELRGGFLNGRRAERNEQELRKVLTKPSSRILLPTVQTTHIYGRLYADLKRRGQMIPTNDIWIAALTIEYEGVLATYDTDFAVIGELSLAFSETIEN